MIATSEIAMYLLRTSWLTMMKSSGHQRETELGTFVIIFVFHRFIFIHSECTTLQTLLFICHVCSGDSLSKRGAYECLLCDN